MKKISIILIAIFMLFINVNFVRAKSCEYDSETAGHFSVNITDGKVSLSGGSNCTSGLNGQNIDVDTFVGSKCPTLYISKTVSNGATYCDVYSQNYSGTTATAGKLASQNSSAGSKETYQSTIIATNLDYSNTCSNEVLDAMKIIGIIINIIRIVAPLLIIIFGMLDYFKAVTSDDEKAVSKATQSLIRRLISGVVIFFIQTIIWGIFNVIDITDGIHDLDNSEFGSCTRCLLKLQCNGSVNNNNSNTSNSNNNSVDKPGEIK